MNKSKNSPDNFKEKIESTKRMLSSVEECMKNSNWVLEKIRYELYKLHFMHLNNR